MMSSRTKEVFLAAQSGDPEALERLVCEHIRLVHSIAGRFSGRGGEADDLFQIGAIGLIKAVYGFDTERGLMFSTYAVPMIMGEIRRYLRDDNIIKVSRHLKELSLKAKYLKDELAGKMAREPTVCEIATQLGVSREELAAAVEATSYAESIYKPLDDTGGGFLMDKISAGDDMCDNIASRLTVAKLLGELEIKMRQVIYYRYFEDKKQTDIAKIMGISQVQVSRLEKKALKCMREILLKNKGAVTKCTDRIKLKEGFT